MKKIIQPLFLLIISMLFLHQEGVSQTTGSYVPAYKQEQSNWCWAACGQMLYWAYKPGTITQCSWVAKSRDEENRLLFDCNNLPSSGNPCTNPGPFNNPQSLYTCGGSIENVLDAYGVGSTGYSYAFSGSQLTTALSARKLMVARWGWNSGGGHFVVVNRYKSGNVSYNNPSSGSAVTWTYNTFKSANNKGNWTHTLRMNSGSVYGSTYSRTPMTSVKNLEDATVSDDLIVNVYPNPTTEVVNILLSENASASGTILITNAVGKIVYQQNIRTGSAQNLRVNVADWGRGVYLIKSGKTIKKLIVM